MHDSRISEKRLEATGSQRTVLRQELETERGEVRIWRVFSVGKEELGVLEKRSLDLSVGGNDELKAILERKFAAGLKLGSELLFVPLQLPLVLDLGQGRSPLGVVVPGQPVRDVGPGNPVSPCYGNADRLFLES
jgi:hypothetical protein